jgi:hypothetical protein
VHGAAHQQAAHGPAAQERPVERLRPETLQPGPEPDIGGRGELRLQPGDTLERRDDAQPGALQQLLPGEARAVQLALRQDPLGPPSTLTG